jgi:DNA modification methylase
MKLNIKEIKLNSHNPRDITPEQFAKLKKSLQEFPQMLDTRPLVIDENNVVLGGNMRLRVLQDLGFEDVPVKQVIGWTEEQKKEFIIKDNLSYGMWDWEMLANEWDAEQLEDWGLEIEGWKEEKLEAQEDNFEVPDEIQTDIQLGDIIEIGEHRLMCGDSTDDKHVEKLMNGQKADMVFTDPPYNVNVQSRSKKRGLDTIKNDNMFEEDFIGFMYLVFNNLFLFSKDDCASYVWHNHKCQSIFEEQLIENNYEIKSQIIWVKDIPSYSNNIFRQQHEIAFYCSKKGNDILLEDGKDSTIWNIPSVQSAKSLDEFGQSWFKGGSENLNLHVTQKPIQLPTKALNFNSRANDVILDLFLGSGSTMVACHQLNRKCYGMELDPKYCQVIVDRMIKLDPKLVIKKNGELYISGN